MAEVRLLVLAVLVALFAIAQADGVEENDPGPQDEVESFRDLGPEEDVDLHELLTSFFEDSEDEGDNREARADEVDDAKEISKYTNFFDILARRLNSKLRTEADPMSLNLAKKKKGKKDKKGKGKSDKKEKNKEKKEQKKEKKMKEKKEKKGKKEGTKEDKARRHPRNFQLEESPHRVAREAAAEDAEDDDEEELVVFENAENFRESRDMDSEDDSQITSRKGKPAGKKEGKKEDKKEGKKEGKKEDKKEGKKNKDGKKGKSKKSSSSRATLKGLASVQRIGDVKVSDHKKGKKIRAEFSVGPVELSMNKKVGGKDKEELTATAIASKVDGVMFIEVSANGNANVKDVKFKRPEGIKTVGSLTRDATKKSGQKGAQRGLSRSRPLIQKKFRLLAQTVLKDSRKN